MTTTAASAASSRRIAVVGLGYVGLPVALAFARKLPGVIGFDINPRRVEALRAGSDATGEASTDELRSSSITFTSDPAELRDANLYVVAVPTPIDQNRRPDLEPLRRASELIGKALRAGDIVVYESTVYPGVTEEFCGPILSASSGLRQGIDFKLGYSPERINPGDREHTIARVVKVVSAQDAATLEVVAAAYEAIVEAGVHRAPSIKVAEAAKVIENTQRDLNIALMNEFALIFNLVGIRTADVLEAASTKWNFLRFSPGLVGGHCIGVDPYYLTTKAEELGYHPEVILSGRRINDNMGRYVAQQLVKRLAANGGQITGARVGILGLTFKENVPDLRNSRVPDIIDELRQFGISPLVHDPQADPDQAESMCEIRPSEWGAMRDLDAVVLAVPHREYVDMPTERLLSIVRDGGAVIDVRSILDPSDVTPRCVYWSL